MHLVARETLPEPNSQGKLLTPATEIGTQEWFRVFGPSEGKEVFIVYEQSLLSK